MLSPSFGQCYDSSRWQASNESCANRRPLRRDPDEIKDSDSCRHRILVDCFFEIGYTACALEWNHERLYTRGLRERDDVVDFHKRERECAVLWKKSKMWHVFQLMIILIDSCFILYLKEDKYSSSEWMDCTTLIPWTDPSEFDMNWKLGVIYFCSPSPLKRRPETVVNTPTKPFFYKPSIQFWNLQFTKGHCL